jgi:16S rRNA (cytosine967-C5)-methyltransferase
MKDGTLVRSTAATTLDRIVRTGAYSNIVVHGTDLSDRDRSAHQNLVFAALRWMIPVDVAIAAASSRSLTRVDPTVLSVLRIAATELLILGHSTHGVVDGAVDAIDVLGVARAKGYVNAVARALSVAPTGELAARDAFPSWMPARLEGAFTDIDPLLASLNEPARPGLRARRGQTLEAAAVEGIADAFYVTVATDLETLVATGDVDIMDPASTAVASALEVGPDHLVADLAAAPGGKTRAIADRITGSGWVMGSDQHRTRLQKAARRASTGDRISWIRMDALEPAYRTASFDRVLLDAPCTGLGTLRRRPEIRHKISPDAPQRYGQMQRAMLTRALTLVARGGRLVYSVCTLFPEETTEAISGLGGRPPDMPIGDVMGEGRMLTPLNAGTDGMFISVFDR